MEDYKKDTMASYDKYCDEYSKKFGKLLEIQRRYEFGRFLELMEGDEILDLGCGSGDHATYFSELGMNVSCIDLSSEMIKECKAKGLNAEVMDIEDLKFGDESFDGVWAVTSLLHVPKKNFLKVGRKLHSILRDDGMLYVCLKKGEGEGFVDNDYEDSRRFFSYWGLDEIVERLSGLFEVVESREVNLGEVTFLEIFFRKV